MQGYVANKHAELLVLGWKVDDAKKAQTLSRGTNSMNLLKRAFAESKRVLTPCHILYFGKVRQGENTKHHTPSLNGQLTGK